MRKKVYSNYFYHLEGKKFHLKLFRLWEPEPKLMWEGNAELHIQRRRDGKISVLTPKPDQIPLSWAEYCHEDIVEAINNHYIHCTCEDYLMIIC